MLRLLISSAWLSALLAVLLGASWTSSQNVSPGQALLKARDSLFARSATPEPLAKKLAPKKANTGPKGKILKILVISDTHVGKEGAGKGDPKKWTPQFGMPDADILIHSGDFSDTGAINEYQKIYDIVKKHKAKVKILIGGNHDTTLDPGYFRDAVKKNYVDAVPQWMHKNPIMNINKAKAMWGTRENGMHYLPHGYHEIPLPPGWGKRTLTLYASPITPEFNHFAFAYSTGNPFATWKKPVDLIVSHGPPKGHYDQNPEGKSFGDPNLMAAFEAVKPALLVFGHNHPVPGAETAGYWNWDAKTGVPAKGLTEPGVRHMDISSKGTDALWGDESLIVNAAVIRADNTFGNPSTMINWHLTNRHKVPKGNKKGDKGDGKKDSKFHKAFGKIAGKFKPKAAPPPPN